MMSNVLPRTFRSTVYIQTQRQANHATAAATGHILCYAQQCGLIMSTFSKAHSIYSLHVMWWHCQRHCHLFICRLNLQIRRIAQMTPSNEQNCGFITVFIVKNCQLQVTLTDSSKDLNTLFLPKDTTEVQDLQDTLNSSNVMRIYNSH